MFMFWETYIITSFLRNTPQIDPRFQLAETLPPFNTILDTFPNASKFNIFGAVIALLVALFTRAVKLHDLVSDVLGIRRRFDCNYILFPLAALVGENLSSRQKEAATAARSNLMRQVFYRYASSRADSPLVDKHEIEYALDQWSWFWVCVEAIVLCVLASCSSTSRS